MSSRELLAGLDAAGVQTLKYRAGDDADRVEQVNSVQQARFSPGQAQKRTGRTNSDSGVIWAGSDTSQSASRPATPLRQSDSRSLAGPPIAPLSSAQSPLLSHPPDGECSLRSLAPPLPTKQMFHGGPFFGSLSPPLAALRRFPPQGEPAPLSQLR